MSNDEGMTKPEPRAQSAAKEFKLVRVSQQNFLPKFSNRGPSHSSSRRASRVAAVAPNSLNFLLAILEPMFILGKNCGAFEK
jgi:hypothetical protein